MKKPLPQNLTDDDLIAQLTEIQSDDTVDVPGHDIPLFISTYNIQSGTEPVNNKLLHRLYKSWSKNPVDEKAFSREINLYFTGKNGRSVNININALKLSKMAQDEFLKRKTVKSRSPMYRSHLEAFMKHYGVKKGTFWMRGEILFDLYQKWCYSNKSSTKLGPVQLTSILKLYFKFKKVCGGTMMFAVDQSITKHFSNERLEKTRNSRKKHAQTTKAATPEES